MIKYSRFVVGERFYSYEHAIKTKICAYEKSNDISENISIQLVYNSRTLNARPHHRWWFNLLLHCLYSHCKSYSILRRNCKACIWICHLCYEDVQWLILYREHFLYALFKVTYCFANKQSICLILNFILYCYVVYLQRINYCQKILIWCITIINTILNNLT